MRLLKYSENCTLIPIKYNNNEIGKVLIKNKFPFALIKYSNENFNTKNEFKCGNAVIKVIKPSWIK